MSILHTVKVKSTSAAKCSSVKCSLRSSTSFVLQQMKRNKSPEQQTKSQSGPGSITRKSFAIIAGR